MKYKVIYKVGSNPIPYIEPFETQPALTARARELMETNGITNVQLFKGDERLVRMVF